MARKHTWHPFPRQDSPDYLKDAKQKQSFTDSEKHRRRYVAGPMRAEVNSRISNRQSDKPAQPAAAPVKQVKYVAAIVLFTVCPEGNEGPERSRSEESEDRTIGFLNNVRNFGRAFCNCTIRTVWTCFGR